MAKTAKKKVKDLKPGRKVQIPAQTCLLKAKSSFAHPTIKGGLMLLTIEGTAGPFKGRTWEVLAHETEEMDMFLLNPPVRRLFDWIADKIWRRLV